MVVIGIVAVLIGVLLPRLAERHQWAQSVAYGNHMRETSNAITVSTNQDRKALRGPLVRGTMAPGKTWQTCKSHNLATTSHLHACWVGRSTANLDGLEPHLGGRHENPGDVIAKARECPADTDLYETGTVNAGNACAGHSCVFNNQPDISLRSSSGLAFNGTGAGVATDLVPKRPQRQALNHLRASTGLPTPCRLRAGPPDQGRRAPWALADVTRSWQFDSAETAFTARTANCKYINFAIHHECHGFPNVPNPTSMTRRSRPGDAGQPSINRSRVTPRLTICISAINYQIGFPVAGVGLRRSGDPRNPAKNGAGLHSRRPPSGQDALTCTPSPHRRHRRRGSEIFPGEFDDWHL